MPLQVSENPNRGAALRTSGNPRTTFALVSNVAWDALTGVPSNISSLQSLADPGADRILFWDDSANNLEWLSLGSNLAITDTMLGLDDVAVFDANDNIINSAGRAASFSVALPQGRLTLTSGTSITTSDVTGATTLYYTPADVPIYNGTQYACIYTGGELSNITTNSSIGKAGPAAVASNSIYDLYVWNDSGTIRLTRSPAWLSNTSRGTGAGTAEIELIGSIWVNKVAITNGPAAQRGTLVGSVRSDSSAQLKDTMGFRWVSNIYNAVERPMRITDPVNNYTYTLAAYQQANGNAANQLDFLQSLGGGCVKAKVLASAFNSSASGTGAGVGIDVDTLNTTAITDNLSSFSGFPVANIIMSFHAEYTGFPGMGRHVLIWKEYSLASGTTTWFGDAAGTLLQSGIFGQVYN